MNDKWTMDKVLLKPGIVVDILNRHAERERELLQKISDLVEESRKLKAAPVQAQKSVEDYALEVLNGFMSDTLMPADPVGMASAMFDIAEAMIAERERRYNGGGNA